MADTGHAPGFALQRAHLQRDAGGMRPIIGVQHGDIGTARRRQPDVARRIGTGFCATVQQANARVLGGHGLYLRNGVILRPIVDHQNFQGPPALPAQAFQCGGDRGPGIARGHQDADQRAIASLWQGAVPCVACKLVKGGGRVRRKGNTAQPAWHKKPHQAAVPCPPMALLRGNDIGLRKDQVRQRAIYFARAGQQGGGLRQLAGHHSGFNRQKRVVRQAKAANQIRIRIQWGQVLRRPRPVAPARSGPGTGQGRPRPFTRIGAMQQGGKI